MWPEACVVAIFDHILNKKVRSKSFSVVSSFFKAFEMDLFNNLFYWQFNE